MKRGEENTDYVNASFIDVSLLESSCHFLPVETSLPHAASYGKGLSHNTPSLGFVRLFPLDLVCVTGGCEFLSPRNPSMHGFLVTHGWWERGAGAGAEPHIPLCLLRRQALTMALQKRMHVAVEVIALRQLFVGSGNIR